MTSDPGSPAAPAWFGKLACLGDFASRRLHQDMVQVLDVWLSTSLDASRGLLGDRWLNTYLSSPLWRFALAPGVLNGQWWFGVMMPSVDSVGRYFPLLVLDHRTEVPSDGTGLALLENWWSEVASAALGTLQAGSSLQTFESALTQTSALPQVSARPPQTASPWPDRSQLALTVDETVAGALVQLAMGEGLQQLRGCSLWSTHRPGAGPSHLSRTIGLPKPESFARLLDGTW
jgi:type VI secretion system protein ImpM